MSLSSLRALSKKRAFLLHLSASALVVGTLCALIFFLWYPEPYFAAKGAASVLRVLVGVDLILGPLLTLILFKPHKPGLIVDVSVIAIIQLSALIYGTTVIYQERPYYSVFAVDRFQVLSYGEVDSSMITHDELRQKPFIGPVLAVARLPEDQETFQQLLHETLFEGKPDIDRRPEFWQPYSEGSAAVIARARSLTDLISEKPEAEEEVTNLTEKTGRSIDSLAYLPFVGKGESFTYVIDAETGTPIDIINVDPWG
ncbi:MAG: TfpX/TfpZ family type IV pilin accessory protein [Candidatus Rariloculaceae bacterium]